MKIVFVTGNYPSVLRPFEGTFVEQFVRAMVRLGNVCTVIKPVSLLARRFGPLPPLASKENCGGGHQLEIYRPRYMSFSSRRFGVLDTGRWSNAAFTCAALRQIKNQTSQPHLVYGHFMYPAGYAAIRGGEACAIPSVVGVGEGEFWTLAAVGDRRAALQMGRACAFLAVSRFIAEELNSRLNVPLEKIGVFPNGVDLRRFHATRDRAAECRNLGLPVSTFNVAFVGPFVVHKGYPQLREAVAGMEGIGLVLMGRGRPPSPDPQIAYAGTVPHEKIGDYLRACDILVLPTSIEGSCNAVIEAMACGLPIITSNGRYMDDIVDDEVAIRVDPMDVAQIRDAIVALKNDPERRKRMTEACLEKAKRFDIDERARRVKEWMEVLVRRSPK